MVRADMRRASSLLCLLNTFFGTAALADSSQAFTKCLAERAGAICGTNFSAEPRFPVQCLLERPEALEIAITHCLETTSAPSNDESHQAYGILEKTCEVASTQWTATRKDRQDSHLCKSAGLLSGKNVVGDVLSDKFEDTSGQIRRRNANEDSVGGSLSRGALAGIASGGGILAAGLLSVCGFCVYRQRNKRLAKGEDTLTETGEKGVTGGNVIGNYKAELPSDDKMSPVYALDGTPIRTNFLSATSTLPPCIDGRFQQIYPDTPVELPSTSLRPAFELEANSKAAEMSASS